jgi:hypothetical protein
VVSIDSARFGTTGSDLATVGITRRALTAPYW